MRVYGIPRVRDALLLLFAVIGGGCCILAVVFLTVGLVTSVRDQHRTARQERVERVASITNRFR
jgi:hypothetical protein